MRVKTQILRCKLEILVKIKECKNVQFYQMLRNCENPLGYFGFQRKPSKTQRNPERPRLRIRLRIRLDDFVIITRGRARYIADDDESN